MIKRFLKKIFTSPIVLMVLVFLIFILSTLGYTQLNITAESDTITCLMGVLLLLVDVICIMSIAFIAIFGWQDKNENNHKEQG